MKTKNNWKYFVTRRVLEAGLGGLVIFLASTLEAGSEDRFPFLASMLLAAAFQVSGLFLFSSLLFERWNYAGNIAVRSGILSAIFLVHFVVLSVPIRILPNFYWEMFLGLIGASVVFLLNFFIRPK